MLGVLALPNHARTISNRRRGHGTSQIRRGGPCPYSPRILQSLHFMRELYCVYAVAACAASVAIEYTASAFFPLLVVVA